MSRCEVGWYASCLAECQLMNLIAAAFRYVLREPLRKWFPRRLRSLVKISFRTQSCSCNRPRLFESHTAK